MLRGVQRGLNRAATGGLRGVSAARRLDTPQGPPYHPVAFRRGTVEERGVSEKDGFEDRLRQARTRQGLETPKDPAVKLGGTSPYGIGFRAGVEVVSALIVGILIGYLLDRWLGTWPWLFLLLFVAGSAAGILNVYRLFNPRGGRPS